MYIKKRNKKVKKKIDDQEKKKERFLFYVQISERGKTEKIYGKS